MLKPTVIAVSLLFSAAMASADAVNIAIGDGDLPNQIGNGFTTSSDNGLAAEANNMWGATNNANNSMGVRYGSYSTIAGATLPATIEAGTYTFSARVGQNGQGPSFPGLVNLNETNFLRGLGAGFFFTPITSIISGASAPQRAEATKNNMFTEWNSEPSVTYTQPTEADPAADTFTTWTFSWEIAPGSPLIGTDPFFGVFVKTGASGGNGFWDDSSLSFTPYAGPPTVASFTATPSALLDDREILLSWEVLDADTVSIDQGIGTVASSGSTPMLVNTTSLPLTFTLTATNANGPTEQSVTVTARGITESPALMAYWPFDGDLAEETFGWSAAEDNGADNIDHIEFTSDVPALISGRRSQSLHFDTANADDFIATGFDGVAGTAPRSVSYWVKTADQGDACTFSYGTNNNGGSFLHRIEATGISRVAFRSAGEAITPAASVPQGNWTHIAIVYAGVSGDIDENATIYVNGTRYNQTGFVGTVPVNSVRTPLWFGRDTTQPDTSPAYMQDVSLAEWAFFSGELTTAQVQALAAGGDPGMLDGTTTPTPPFISTEHHYRDLPSGDPDYIRDKIRVYHPPLALGGISSRPAILFFHGGGWSNGDASQFDQFCEPLAAAGFVTATANYRFTSHSTASSFSDPKERCVADARLATAWLEDRAAPFGFADGQVMLGGGSAGGHLATMVALRPSALAAVSSGPVTIPALLLLNPAYHESETSGSASAIVDPERQLALYGAASLPPAIFFYGNYDPWRTPLTFKNASNANENGFGRALPFIDAFRTAGGDAELWYAIGEAHSFFNAVDWAERCVDQIDTFLRARSLTPAVEPPPSFAHPELPLQFGTALHAWRLNYFLNEANAGTAAESANPDDDPFDNFTEFALGTNPLVRDSAPPLRIEGEILRFSRHRSDITSAPSPVTVELQSSTTLEPGSWDPVTIAPENVESFASSYESLAVPREPTSLPAIFYRLEIRDAP